MLLLRGEVSIIMFWWLATVPITIQGFHTASLMPRGIGFLPTTDVTSVPIKRRSTSRIQDRQSIILRERAQSSIGINDGEEVDVIIIGSGLAGLSCGALLSHSGYKVAVLESHDVPGGCAHGWERQGYHFESGPSLYR